MHHQISNDNWERMPELERDLLAAGCAADQITMPEVLEQVSILQATALGAAFYSR